MGTKYVCSGCVETVEYKSRIINEGYRRACTYCKKKRKSINLEELASWVDDEYRDSYEPSDGGGDFPCDLVSEMLDAEPQIAEDLVDILAEREERDVGQGADAFYDSDSRYIRRPFYGNVHEHIESWEYFCNRIKHERRFFNHDLIDYLAKTFGSLKRFQSQNGTPLRTINPENPDATFYRARLVKSPTEEEAITKRPDRELGPPPGEKARAGRMNPAGVPVFYGAFEKSTCIAEIRPSVGDKVIIGKFKLEKSVTVLDLTILSDINEPSYLAGDDIDNLCGLYNFLKGFSAAITQPVREFDSHLEYLPTQAISEYFCHELKIDAVIYPSSLTANEQRNIVLLARASKVKRDGQSDYFSFVVESVEKFSVNAVSYKCDPMFDEIQYMNSPLLDTKEIIVAQRLGFMAGEIQIPDDFL